MALRHTYSFFIAALCLMSVGCCGYYRNAGCLGSNCATCGVADMCCDEPSCCCPEPSCCCEEPSCCCPEPSCCCEEPSCCCPEPACGCPTDVGCGSPVCGSPVMRRCRLLQRLRNAFCGCSSYGDYGGCSCDVYCGDWHSYPPSGCAKCDSYGNYIGEHRVPSGARRMNVARRPRGLDESLTITEEDETTYR